MKNSKYKWQLPKEEALDPDLITASQQLGLSPLLLKLLVQRGIDTEEKIRGFLQPQLSALHDPYLFVDMDKVVTRLQEAVAAGEKILVYGDYDADGITSTTIMVETLELLGGDVSYYLPNRFTDGYGPNQRVYEEKIAEGVQLIMTVDNGVSGHEAIAYANSQGVDVIVTDHHELPAVLPAAYGIIHPRHPEGTYPFGELAGVGVAFKVACALLDEIPTEFLDLVAIGTIADMVSLTDENRVMVKAGLNAIKHTERLGLQELLTVSGVDLQSFDEQSVGFAISPRLNAIGRLGDPNPAVALMMTFDEEEAHRLATELNQINDQRKNLVETITKEALALVAPTNAINLIAKTGWHEGVLGIVAGRVMQATGKPTIVLTIKEDGSAKGSGRSTEDLNLFEMLDGMRELFTSFGGHHAAVGLSLPEANLALLQQRMNDYILEHQIDLSAAGLLKIDEVLATNEVDLAFIETMKTLAPFGMDNPLPLFLFKDTTMVSVNQMGADQSHLKFMMTDASGGQLEGIGFGFGEALPELQHDLVAIVGELTINEWNGNKKPQLMLKDFAVSGLQVFDLRGKKNRRSISPLKDGLAISFEKKLSKDLSQIFAETDVWHVSDLTATIAFLEKQQLTELIFLDCPAEPQVLQDLTQAAAVERVGLVLDAPDDAYLDGLGTREQYARLFKFIAQQDQVDVRYKLPMVANYLKIPQKLLIFMIQVFSELDFVTINDGVLKKADISAKKELSSSATYQLRLKKIKSEEFLLLSDIQQLKKWLSPTADAK